MAFVLTGMEQPFIGAHVSTAGGLFRCFEHAARIGAQTVQIFGASPRRWDAKMLRKEAITQFQSAWKASAVQTVFLHAAYLVNLASPDATIRKRSVQSLATHFAIANALGANGLIFHIGSGKEMPNAEALLLVIEELKEIVRKEKGESFLVIENAAGGGQKLGSNAAEVGEIMRKVASPRLKVCFDTAHAFEGGTIVAYTKANIAKLFDDWEVHVGLSNIVALHVNDSKSPFNSKYDRHENLGKGYIGLEGFRNLAQEKRLSHASWILEVPGFDGNGPDKENLDILRSCFKNKK